MKKGFQSKTHTQQAELRRLNVENEVLREDKEALRVKLAVAESGERAYKEIADRHRFKLAKVHAHFRNVEHEHVIDGHFCMFCGRGPGLIAQNEQQHAQPGKCALPGCVRCQLARDRAAGNHE